MSDVTDFYGIEHLLDDAGRDAVRRTREFMAKEVEPVINQYWIREEFPHELAKGIARLGIAGVAYEGYGCPGGGPLLDGVLAMQLARSDPSMSTFMACTAGWRWDRSTCAAARSRSSAGCPRWRGWTRSARSA